MLHGIQTCMGPGIIALQEKDSLRFSQQSNVTELMVCADLLTRLNDEFFIL
jgi:hypothetical protein